MKFLYLVTLSLFVLTGLSDNDQRWTFQKLAGTWYGQNGEPLTVSEPMRTDATSKISYAEVDFNGNKTPIRNRNNYFLWSSMKADKNSTDFNKIIWKSKNQNQEWTRTKPSHSPEKKTSKKDTKSIVGKVLKGAGIVGGTVIGLAGAALLAKKGVESVEKKYLGRKRLLANEEDDNERLLDSKFRDVSKKRKRKQNTNLGMEDFNDLSQKKKHDDDDIFYDCINNGNC